MIRRLITGFLCLAFIFLAVRPAYAFFESLKHEYVMKGRILEVNGNTAYLCIGNPGRANAVLGRDFKVYRYVRTGNLSSKPSQRYERVETGAVRITQIVDGHMANAMILSGEIRDLDVVGLK